MSETQTSWGRLALIASLVERAQGKPLGRTALVKLAYCLQVFCKLPLGYNFRLYTYGPFDEDVLFDLAQAESLQVVKVKIVSDNVGYGYEIRPGANVDWLKQRASAWLAEHDACISWVMQEFGPYSAADLELVSTIVYIDQENAKHEQDINLETLVNRVRKIKTRFSVETVTERVQELLAKQLLFKVEVEQPVSV